MASNNNQLLELDRNQMLQELSKSLIKFVKSEYANFGNKLGHKSFLINLFELEDYISEFKIDPSVVDLQNEELVQKVAVLLENISITK